MEFDTARRLTPLAPGVWRSLVAHSLWERGAVGSNPATPTIPPPSASEAARNPRSWVCGSSGTRSLVMILDLSPNSSDRSKIINPRGYGGRCQRTCLGCDP